MADLIDKMMGGDDENDQEIDPELREMAGQRPEGSVLRPVIFVAVMALGLWIYADWRPELQYFFSAWEPVQLGDMTTEFPHDEVGDPTDDEPGVLPHNRYVHLTGITEPGIEPEGGGFVFFMLRGAPVYVMAPKEGGGGRKEMIQAAKKMTLADLQNAGQSQAINMKGRLIDLSRMPKRFGGFKRFFGKKFGVDFCSVFTDAEIERRRERRREVVRERLRLESTASPDEKAGGKQAPGRGAVTEEAVDRAMASEKICEQGYLLRGAQTPWSFWWYVAALGLYGVFMLMNAWWLVRWVQAFAGRGGDESQ
jgi:hypothetical protein